MFIDERIFQNLKEAELTELHFFQENPDDGHFEIWKNSGWFNDDDHHNSSSDVCSIYIYYRYDKDLDLKYLSLTDSDPEFVEFLSNMDEPVSYYYDTPEKREYRIQQITEVIQKFINAVSDSEKFKKQDKEQRRNEVLQ